MTPESLLPLSYLSESSIRKIEKRRSQLICAHMVAKNAAMIFKISASLFSMLSNPGVSIRVTVLPPRVNLSESLTSAVHDSEFVPIRKVEPLARLIN